MEYQYLAQKHVGTDEKGDSAQETIVGHRDCGSSRSFRDIHDIKGTFDDILFFGEEIRSRVYVVFYLSFMNSLAVRLLQFP